MSSYKWVNPNLVKKQIEAKHENNQNVANVRTPEEQKAMDARILAIALKIKHARIKSRQEAAAKSTLLKSSETEKSQTSKSASPQNTIFKVSENQKSPVSEQ